MRKSEAEPGENVVQYEERDAIAIITLNRPERLNTLTEAMVPSTVYPKEIHYVGRYALQFLWSDGHDTGLYSFDLLRGLCRCDACSQEPQGED